MSVARAENLDWTCLRMASSSVQRGAGSSRAPPPPDQLASFYKLVDKAVIAGVLCRHARVVQLSASAAVQAEALFGENSLVVAYLRMADSISLSNLGNVETRGVEREALVRRSWNVLVAVLPLLLRRLEANTLLPGTVWEEELDYAAHVLAVLGKAKNKPVFFSC